MKILLLKEAISDDRVLLVPSDVHTLISKGNEVFFEKGMGLNSGFSDDEYIQAGANIDLKWKKNISTYQVICKVGILSNSLLKKINDKQIIWNYTDVINQPKYLLSLLKNKNTLISLKSIQPSKSSSIFSISEQLKGKFAVTIASYYLSRINTKGLGKLFGKLDEYNSTIFVVGGADVAGKTLIKSSLCLGSDVVAFDYNENIVNELKANETYKELCNINKCSLSVFKYDFEKLFTMLKQADVVVSCADSSEINSHEIFNEKMIASMKPGTVFIDLSSDFGFSSDTERKYGKIESPTFIANDVIHFNAHDVSKFYPSTFACVISSINLKNLLEIKDVEKVKESSILAPAIITCKGCLTSLRMASSLKLNYTNLNEIK